MSDNEFSIAELPDWLKKQLVSPGVHPDAMKTIYASQSYFDEVIYQDEKEHKPGVPVSNFSLESHGRSSGRPYLLAAVCEHLYGEQRSPEQHGHTREAESLHGHIYALSPHQIRHLVTWLQGWLAMYCPTEEE